MRACDNMLALEAELAYGEYSSSTPVSGEIESTPDGVNDELYLDYDLQSASFTTLASAQDLVKNGADATRVKMKLLHEALHIFGYDEEEAHTVSWELIKILERVFYHSTFNDSWRFDTAGRSVLQRYSSIEFEVCAQSNTYGSFVHDVLIQN